MSDALSMISTHAPRTGSDDEQSGVLLSPLPFQPTLPARGATVAHQLDRRAVRRFQPTLPARGATTSPVGATESRYFNPRSPHGERLALFFHQHMILLHFNPRSPHGERPGLQSARSLAGNFNPRSPHGERRRRGKPKPPTPKFQPTLPARGATFFFSPLGLTKSFQPTLPARGATTYAAGSAADLEISTHAPRTGSDLLRFRHDFCFFGFQPTLPARGATFSFARFALDCPFQPTLPARGATLRHWNRFCPCSISTHAPRTGSD